MSLDDSIREELESQADALARLGAEVADLEDRLQAAEFTIIQMAANEVDLGTLSGNSVEEVINIFHTGINHQTRTAASLFVANNIDLVTEVRGR